MAKTLQERYVAALTAAGSVEVKRMAGRCVVMTDTTDPRMFYFVGPAGSIRRGPNRGSSVPTRRVRI